MRSNCATRRSRLPVSSWPSSAAGPRGPTSPRASGKRWR
jgi:hypothetical protein